MVFTRRSNARGAAGQSNEDGFVDPQVHERNVDAGVNRIDPHSVTVGGQSPQRTQAEGSGNTGNSGADAARVAELEGQLAEMRAALRAAGLLKDVQGPSIGGQETVAESAADHNVLVRGPANVMIGSTYKTFLSCKPPVFKGGEDPLVCRRWIRKMERIFKKCSFYGKPEGLLCCPYV